MTEESSISGAEPKYDARISMPVNRNLITIHGMREIYLKLKDGKPVTDFEGNIVPSWIWQGDVRQAIMLQNRIYKKRLEELDREKKTLEEMRFLESRLLEYSGKEEFHVGKKEIKDC